MSEWWRSELNEDPEKTVPDRSSVRKRQLYQESFVPVLTSVLELELALPRNNVMI